MNCKNCKNWAFGRCVVSNLVVGPDMLCNAWELSQSHEMVDMQFATFDDKELQERIAELEAAQRWIPVGEKLPEERQNVLALDKTGTAYHWEYSRSLSNIFVSDYTHWMYLPQPPEVQE